MTSQYMNELHSRPHLSHERIVELFKNIENGINVSSARSKLIESNLRLVVSIAKKYQSAKAQLDDLIQEGNIGLMKSIERYDWRRGFRFSTYSTWWIKQSIRAFIMNQRLIRLPAHAVALQREMIDATADFKREFGRDPTHDELLELTGASARVMKATHDASRGIVSIHEKCKESKSSVNQHERTYEHRIVDRSSGSDPFETVAREEAKRILLHEMSTFSAKEVMILRLRFGIIDGIDDDGFDASLTEDELADIEQGRGLTDDR